MQVKTAAGNVVSYGSSINKYFWLVSDKTSPSLKHNTLIKCCWQSGLQQSTRCLSCCGGSNSKEFRSFINTSRVLNLCFNVELADWKNGVWMVIDTESCFFPFLPPTVVFSTLICYKEEAWDGISGVFLCLQVVSSEIEVSFSIPSVSVLAHVLAKEITLFSAKLVLGI